MSFASLASLVFSLPLPPDLQPIHSHVVRALFGILLKFKQAKWKNCPFSHNGLWHFRSLSEGNGFLLHTHIQSSLKASSKISFVCVPLISHSWLQQFLRQRTKPPFWYFLDFQAGQVERTNGTCLVAVCDNSISSIHPAKADRTEPRWWLKHISFLGIPPSQDFW